MEDNGLGFDLDDTLKNQKSIGLFNLIKRSEIIGYKASIQTEKGKGTEIVITQNTK
jgi:signal transduction histidine kinase